MKECNNQPNDDLGGGWDVGEAMRQGEMCRGGRLPIIWGGQIERCKNKIERAMGPRFLMASSGWGETTTNRDSAQSTEYSLVKRITRR